MYSLFIYDVDIYKDKEDETVRDLGIVFADSFSNAVESIELMWGNINLFKINSIEEVPESSYGVPIHSLPMKVIEVLKDEIM